MREGGSGVWRGRERTRDEEGPSETKHPKSILTLGATLLLIGSS